MLMLLNHASLRTHSNIPPTRYGKHTHAPTHALTYADHPDILITQVYHIEANTDTTSFVNDTQGGKTNICSNAPGTHADAQMLIAQPFTCHTIWCQLTN